MLQTVDGEQTRDWFFLACNVIHNSKINFQILTEMQLHTRKRSSHSEPRVGAQAPPVWFQVSNQTKRVDNLVRKSILLGQGVQASEIKTALALKPGPATVPILRNIPLTSPFQGNSKLMQ